MVKKIFFICLLLLVVFSISLSLNPIYVKASTISSSIELEDFRWNKFPLKVLVNLNEWSISTYALAVRGALDNWMISIWNYTHTYTNMTLGFNYLFYVSDVNSTGSYDIVVSFSQNEISQKAVGLTTFRWDVITHTPITPITINITSYSATADSLFIKNVAMHELGHAFGLGHANTPNTLNGPELMYPASSLKQMVYPSTLNVYGLLMLSNGNFGKTIALPSSIPYMMLAEGSLPQQDQTFPKNILYILVNKLDAFLANPQEILYHPMLLLIPSILWIVITLIFGILFHSETKAILVSMSIFILACYAIEADVDLPTLSLKIVLILPSILIGSSIGALIYRKIAVRETVTVDMGSGNLY